MTKHNYSNYNIIIAGVGGQGTLAASKIMGRVFMSLGHNVKVSEVHGMSQRGGSVVTYVRFGGDIFSPIIDKGEADLIVGFEILETARWLPYLKKSGTIITSDQKINPMTVISGSAAYPADITGKIKSLGVNIQRLDAAYLAGEAGSRLAVNMVLLGAAAKFLGIDKKVWEDTIRETFSEKHTKTNLKAFDLGYLAQ